MTALAFQRTADPYRDTDVIDERAPRVNQTIVGTLALVAFLTGWWPLLTLLGAQLAIGLLFGRRYCLPCLLYFEVIQPRIGEGPLEDSRPPRFANVVGAIFLGAATVAHVVGLAAVGWGLGLIVAALALLAATTGLCVGCEMYKIGARLRGIRAGGLQRIDATDVSVALVDDLVVEFTHPLCTECHELERDLRAKGQALTAIDISRRPDLARKYGIAVVPTAVVVAADGSVRARIA